MVQIVVLNFSSSFTDAMLQEDAFTFLPIFNSVLLPNSKYCKYLDCLVVPSFSKCMFRNLILDKVVIGKQRTNLNARYLPYCLLFSSHRNDIVDIDF